MFILRSMESASVSNNVWQLLRPFRPFRPTFQGRQGRQPTELVSCGLLSFCFGLDTSSNKLQHLLIEVSASQPQPTRHRLPCQSIFVFQILPMPCSICYGSGHNRTTCPSKGDPESKPGPSKNEQSKTGRSKTTKKAIKKKKPKKKARKVGSLLQTFFSV